MAPTTDMSQLSPMMRRVYRLYTSLLHGFLSVKRQDAALCRPVANWAQAAQAAASCSSPGCGEQFESRCGAGAGAAPFKASPWSSPAPSSTSFFQKGMRCTDAECLSAAEVGAQINAPLAEARSRLKHATNSFAWPCPRARAKPQPAPRVAA